MALAAAMTARTASPTTGTRRLSRPARWLLWLLLVAAVGSAGAQLPPQASEASVRAAYVYKFLAYIEWPPASLPQADTPLVVGVVGADDVHEELQAMVAQRTVAGRAVRTRRVAEAEVPDDVHALFVGRGTRDPARLVERLRGKPVLVVTERASGLDAGGMINLVPVDGRIRFEASQVAAERAGLRLGARLLAVADRVVTR
jgi:hypothetical protein